MKKYIKVFLFSFILFCSIFFVSSVKAAAFSETQYFTNYDDIKEAFFTNGFNNDLVYINKNSLVFDDTNILDLEVLKDSSFWDSAFSTCCDSSSNTKLVSLNSGNGLAIKNISIWVQRGYQSNFNKYLINLFFYTSNSNNIKNEYSYISFARNDYGFSFLYDSSLGTITRYGSIAFSDGAYTNGVSISNDVTSLNNAYLYHYSSCDIYNSNGSTLLYSYPDYVFQNSLTIIDNPNSDIVITYEYNQDYSSCHVDATIRNGAFSDKLYYSYQMPSIAGQGLTLGKTAFPSRWYRYNK